MKAKLIMCKGLPGSGKSTWAASEVLKDLAHMARVNKDDIRAELGKPWSAALEKEVLRIRDFRISVGLSAGKTVICDDTNLAPKHEPRLRGLVTKYKGDFEINDSFLAVPIDECIRRDAGREAPVGAKVIRDMAAQYLATPTVVVPYVEDPELSSVVICDLDGTLALHNGRGPFDYDKCDTDTINWPVSHVLHAMESMYASIVFMSGREDVARLKTQAWLDANGFQGWPLYMRAAGDFRKDNVVKMELFDTHIRGKFNVEFVLDDRDQVVKMWRDLGLTCLQVAYGNF